MYNVIMDCDPATTTPLPYCSLRALTTIRLLGVTTVAGNSYIENVTRNARKVLDYAGVTDVDVYAGGGQAHDARALPPYRRDHPRRRWSGRAEIARSCNACTGGTRRIVYHPHRCGRAPKKVVLIPTGPLTNIAMALMQAPDIKEKIDRIIIMGRRDLRSGQRYFSGGVQYLSGPRGRPHRDTKRLQHLLEYAGCFHEGCVL